MKGNEKKGDRNSDDQRFRAARISLTILTLSWRRERSGGDSSHCALDGLSDVTSKMAALVIPRAARFAKFRHVVPVVGVFQHHEVMTVEPPTFDVLAET